jgi:hypothetical protein
MATLYNLIFGPKNYGGSSFEEMAQIPVKQNRLLRFFKNLLKTRKNGNATA